MCNDLCLLLPPFPCVYVDTLLRCHTPRFDDSEFMHLDVDMTEYNGYKIPMRVVKRS